ncbi:MAG: acetylglutamate kinase [Myxococcota bacterium]|nr:acetylglutamate kinase [Myxococcota bacterium]
MERVLSLLEAIPYLRAYAGQRFVIKLGGGLLERPGSLMRDVAALRRLGIGVVLVHGGGPQLDTAAQERGLKTRRIAGRRITSPQLIQTAAQVWRGELSLSLISTLRQEGELAVGLSGADGGLLTAVRRPPQVVIDDAGTRQTVDYGQVGDVVAYQGAALEGMLAAGLIPVISPLAMSESGEILNVNADTVAATIAAGMGAAKLILMTTAPGIMADASDPSTALHWVDLSGLAALESAGSLTGGMRPKLDAIRLALRGGVPRVHVIDGRKPGALLEEVFTTEGCGTLVVHAAAQCPPELSFAAQASAAR